MSANILWQPVDPERGKDLNVSAPSSFIEDIEVLFGKLPVVIGKDSLQTLRGWEIGWKTHPDNPVKRLIEAIETHGDIKIWAQW